MSNNQFKHLLAFDLASYGAALGIINQYVDDSLVKVFEISPCGSSATLILLSSDVVSLQIIKSQSESIFKSQILAISLVENVHEDLLLAYLSQNKTVLKNHLVVLEGSYVSSALEVANSLLKANETLVDFRIIRTFPKNVVLTFTNNKIQSFEYKDFKKTIIENIQPVLKSYYEIN
ncbi:hypothetical protein K2P97_02355 [bacterium]|nr:hypothetical protein [bacterium]